MRAPLRLFSVLTVLLTAVAVSLTVTAGTAGAAPPGRVRYVSPTGTDTGPGSPGRPLQHIQRCADLAGPGDTCVVLAGDYHETVTPARSGTPTAPITFRAMPGATISGDDPVTGWRPVDATGLAALTARDTFLTDSPFATAVGAGQIYAAPLTVSPGLDGVQVFTGGTDVPAAQWPAPGPDPLSPVERYTTAPATKTSLTDPGLGRPDGYWTGAKVLTRYWFMSQTTTVAAHTGNDLSLTAPSCINLKPDEAQYHLYGTAKAFSAPGQYFYDAPAQTLYLWSTSGAPRGVTAKQRTYGFDLTGSSHVRVQGFGLHATSVTTGDDSTGIVLTGLDARYLSSYDTLGRDPHIVENDPCATLTAGETTSGIVLRGHGNALLASTLAFSAGNGVSLQGDHNLVAGNVIHDVDTMGSYAAGVNVIGHDQTVTRNTIARTGRSGITVDWQINGYQSYGNRFSYNDISGYSLLNVDNGAIYVCCRLDMTGTVINRNWLHDAAPKPVQNPWAEAGVYIDNRSGNLQISNNVGWNNPTATVFLCVGNANVKVWGNDGGVVLGPEAFPGTEVLNTIGTVRTQNGYGGGATLGASLPATVDPLYVDPGPGRDFRLQAGSPARNAGVPIPGVTDGGTDPTPSLGAYPYGAARWVAGTSTDLDEIVSIGFTPVNPTVTVGTTATLALSATTNTNRVVDLSGAQVELSSLDPTIASVDADGTVHALGLGSARLFVRATVGSLVATASTTVRVSAAQPAGPNIARGRPVDVSSTYTAAYTGDKIVDGDTVSTASRWLSATTDPAPTATIHLATTTTPKLARITSGTGTATLVSFTVQERAADGTWTTVATVAGNTAPVLDLPLAAQATDTVRLVVTTPSRDPVNVVRIFEVELYEQVA